MFTCFWTTVFLLAGAAEAPATVRTWTDATGQYTAEAALVDFDTQNVVLKKHSGALVAVPIADLSKADQDYLRSQAASEAAEQHSGGNRTWTLRDGHKFVGQVLLVPGPGVIGGPMQVVVPARDSRAARMEAMSRNPGYTATQVVRINRRWWR